MSRLSRSSRARRVASFRTGGVRANIIKKMGNCTKTSIPGIRGIYWVAAEDVPPAASARSAAGLKVFISADAREVDFIDVATCDINEKQTRAGVAWSSKLRFVSTQRISDPRPKVWIVIDNDGGARMLGQKEAPWPRMTVDTASGDFGSRKAISYEVRCITRPVEVVFGGREVS